MRAIVFTAMTVLVALLHCTGLFGQSAPRPAQPATFHVQGTIRSPWHSVPPALAPPTEVTVTFKSNQVSSIVTVDSKGFYQVDLPVGLYTMTAEAQKMGPQHLSVLTKYVRPLFRVTLPTTIIVNGNLYTERMTCDIVVRDLDQEMEMGKDACGGEDFFPAPSRDGAPFQLYVRYPQRQHTEQGYVYNSDSISQPDVPVFVAYNLFTLEANRVTYDAKHRTIEANGDVVVTNESGVAEHVASIAIKIENGHAIRLQ